MGVALTHRLLEDALSATHPGRTIYPADAEYALWAGQTAPAPPNPAATVGTWSARRPDHLWVVVDAAGTGIEAVYASESKATHRGPAAARRRMAEGCAQLTGIGAVVGGAWTPVTGFVFGTSLNRRQIRVQAVDPKGLDLAGKLPPRDEGRARRRAVRFDEGARAEIVDREAFRGVAIDTGRAQLLSYAGSYAEAARVLGVSAMVDDTMLPARSIDDVRLEATEERVERESPRGVERGSVITASLTGGERIEVFFGVDRDSHNAITSGDAAREQEVSTARRLATPQADDPDDETIARAYADDGGILEIRRR